MSADSVPDAVLKTTRNANASVGEPHSSAELLAEYLHTQQEAIVDGEFAVRRGESDAIAAIVVAARRARSALAAHRAASGRHPGLRQLIEELRWFGLGLGSAHELRAQATRITGALESLRPRYVRGPVRKRIAAYFEVRIRPAEADSLGFLGSDRYRTMMGDLAEEVASLRDGSSAWASSDRVDMLLSDLAARFRARMRTVEAAEDEDVHDAAVHAVRKAGRRMRYYLGSVRESDPGHCDSAIADLALLQDILGEHHDAVVAKHHLLQLTKEAENAEESTFTYGMLYECELVTASHCSYQLADASRQALDDVRVISESPH